MPIYEEKIKDKNEKMVPKLVGDGKQKQYYIRTYVEDEFGNRKQITRHNKKWLGRDGKIKAQQEETRLLSKIITQYDNITFLELKERFLTYKKDSVKYSTHLKYSDDINHYVVPYFPIKKQINKITTSDILEWKNKLNTLPLSITTKKRTYTTLSSIFKYGCTYYNLDKNVVSLAGNFKATKGEVKEMNFLTQEEFNKFIEFEKNILYKDFFTILFYTGMRRGELLALKSSDIDIENNTITICKSYNPKYEKNGCAESTPKTNKSNRTIQMLKPVKNILNRYSNKEDRIFKDITLTTLKRKCDKNCVLAGITKPIRIHDFRHSFASMCIDKEVPIAVLSEYLGHENISITLDTYSHLYPNSQFKLLDKFK